MQTLEIPRSERVKHNNAGARMRKGPAGHIENATKYSLTGARAFSKPERVSESNLALFTSMQVL